MTTNKNAELELIPPQSANFLRSITHAIAKQLKAKDTASIGVPTLLARARALVTQKSFITLLTSKEDNDE